MFGAHLSICLIPHYHGLEELDFMTVPSPVNFFTPLAGLTSANETPRKLLPVTLSREQTVFQEKLIPPEPFLKIANGDNTY